MTSIITGYPEGGADTTDSDWGAIKEFYSNDSDQILFAFYLVISSFLVPSWQNKVFRATEMQKHRKPLKSSK